MEKAMKEKRDDALSFLLQGETGVLATVSREGTSRARLVYYTADDAFNVYFITLANTRKMDDLAVHPEVSFVVSETDIPHTLQIEGTVTDLTETATNDPLLVNFMNMLASKKSYGVPLAHLDTGVIRFFKLTPTWVRWGDFTLGEGTDAVLTEIKATEEKE